MSSYRESLEFVSKSTGLLIDRYANFVILIPLPFCLMVKSNLNLSTSLCSVNAERGYLVQLNSVMHIVIHTLKYDFIS